MSRTAQPRRGRGAGRPVTAEGLEAQALHYLARFASSAASLRRVLRRKVERSARDHGTDREAGLAAVERIIERFSTAGIIDDARFAEGRAQSLFRRGTSRRATVAKLGEKGIGQDQIAAALDSLDEISPEPELAAAIAYARRRRLGPFRPPDARAGLRDKDMAAFGRAGFASEVARRVLDAPDAEALEAELEPTAR